VTKKIIKYSFKLVAAAIAVTSIVCCQEHPEPTAASLKLRVKEYKAELGNQFVSVEAEGSWTLSIDFGQNEGEITQWAYLDADTTTVVTGSGSRNDIVLGWARNFDSETRTLSLILETGGQKIVESFSQEGIANSYYQHLPVKLVADAVPDWLELPATNDKRLFFITHPMTIGKQEVRNYSFYWDTTALVAHWVAYPLNDNLISNGSRSNEWGLDPKVPRRLQPVIFGAYNDARYGTDGWYNRGHQLPSADRLNYEANVATFYGTNMTPQMSELNAQAWGVLEGMVRTWARKCDTLYVVTGCTVDGSTTFVKDNEGKKVTVPTGYFKALLGYKKNGTIGISGATGGYTSTAFWFDHKEYKGNSTTVMAQKITVDQLEAKTGIDFFVNLPAKIGEKNAATVESSNDSWWK